ncbi:unnamed protein product [Sphenostylis stenocarpa]|uniref:Uncharacterized protein n=1 Tax=Sphenostylis stenocarpa TaxID=92480 RepID=A0AA86SU45_9FABA|nr:unnamed protein product [Sphenostylis stenocarpa]
MRQLIDDEKRKEGRRNVIVKDKEDERMRLIHVAHYDGFSEKKEDQDHSLR